MRIDSVFGQPDQDFRGGRLLRWMFLLLLLDLLSAGPSWAAITYDTSSSGEGTTSTSHSHTFAADANIAIICVAVRDSGAAVAAVSAVTVGGQAATLLARVANAGNVVASELWYKLAPTAGSQTVAVTSGAGTDMTVTGVMSFKGVAQSSSFNTQGTAEGVTANAADVDALASAVGELGVLCGAGRTATTPVETVAADATSPVSTERFDHDYSASTTAIRGWGYTEPGATTSINMRVDYNADASTQWATVAVSMRAAADDEEEAVLYFP